MRPMHLALALSMTFVATVAHAQDAAPSPAPAPAQPAPSQPAAKPAAAKPATAKPTAAGPKAAKPKTPYLEAIRRGDNAYLARDFEGALAAYREAIQKEPQNPLGHYRIGEVQAAKNDLKEAEQAYNAALRFVGKDAVLLAKIQFCLADLAERQRAFDQALQAWDVYGKTAEDPKSKAFPASAGERKKVVENEKKLIAEYAEVKARIEKRLQEADAAAKKSAK